MRLAMSLAAAALAFVPNTGGDVDTGVAVATIYADANDNGRADRGEEVMGIRVVLTNSGDTIERTSGPDGQVSFPDLPPGVYSVRYEGGHGWLTHPDFYDDRWTIEPGGQLRLVRPVVPSLSVKLKFGQPSYTAGETLGITVTLSNHRRTAFGSVKALCSNVYEPGEVPNTDPGWGPLAQDGAGIALDANETKTVEVTNAITDDMPLAGLAMAKCRFGPDPTAAEATLATAAAKVTGVVGRARGLVVHVVGDVEQPVPAITLVLRDELTDEVAASAVTDAGGRFDLERVPTGWYRPVVDGPWRLVEPVQDVKVHGGFHWEHVIRVEPGTAQPGSSVVGRATVGVLAVGASALAITATRRKRGMT